jgi:hypothetical protein
VLTGTLGFEMGFFAFSGLHLFRYLASLALFNLEKYEKYFLLSFYFFLGLGL